MLMMEYYLDESINLKCLIVEVHILQQRTF